jgi:hypothetical protein
MKIWNIPIESLEERYSKSWNEYFPVAFEEADVEFETIYPEPLSDKIRDGSFLDICGTNYFKALQLVTLSKKLYDGEIKAGDIIFVQDLWFPGLEGLAYIRQGLNLDFKICGILHAGTYDPHDFLTKCGMKSWGRHLEVCWFDFVDKIFVATNFHKELIYQNRRVDYEKIVVTGLPIYSNQCHDMSKKENIVVFPHRLDSEKQPEMFDLLSKEAATDGWQFIKSKEVCKNKKEYFELLNRSKIAVSFAQQETWGIAQQEALFANCFPVVPSRLSYEEMYSNVFKYSSFADALLLVKKLMEPDYSDLERLRQNKNFLLLKGIKAIPNMIKEMRNL